MMNSFTSENSQMSQSLCARIDVSMQNIQDLQPTAFSLTDFNNELHSMALIQPLPD